MSEEFEIKDIYLQYDFTEEELKRLANKLAYAAQQKEAVVAQKKSVMADFKSQIDNLDMTIGSTSQKVTNGYEMRHTECKVRYNIPYVGMKQVTRSDTGVTWEEQMDRNDFNLFNQGNTTFNLRAEGGEENESNSI